MMTKRIAAQTALLSASLVVLGLISASPAATIIPGSNSNMIVSDPIPVGDGSESLWQVTVSIEGLQGGIPGAFDGSFTGRLHQQDLFGSLSSPTTDDPISGTTIATQIDTHFLLPRGAVLAVEPPNGLGLTEDFGQPSSEASDATGPQSANSNTSFGTHLSGTWALFDPQSIVLPLAQIVGPAQEIAYDFDVNIVGFGEESYAGVLSVPEPSSLSLTILVLLLGFVVRRPDR